MKTAFPNSAKRVLSLVLSLVMLIGTMFVANVGVTIGANAETASQNATGKTKVVYLEDASKAASTINNMTLSNFTQEGDYYIIDSVEKLAYVCTKIDTATSYLKKFKVADNIKEFVLQTETYIDSIGGLAALKAMSAAEVKTKFEAVTSGVYNWLSTSGCFNGYFDGNGVAIYGLYVKGYTSATSAKSESALFPSVDGGGNGETIGQKVDGVRTCYTDTTGGTTIKNFALRNSYIQGSRWIGGVIGTANWYDGGAYTYGFVRLSGCEVSNCAIVGMAYKKDKTDWTSFGQMGIVTGAVNNDPVKADNLLVYGNKTWFIALDGTATEDAFTRVMSNGSQKNDNASTDAGNITIYPELKNSVIIDATVSDSGVNQSANYISDVYTNVSENFVGVTPVDDSMLKGSTGKTLLWKFNWANAATAGDGTVQWYARENDYPTLIMPDGWKDTVKGSSIWSGTSIDTSTIDYDDGTGTKEDPYIISNADQLWKMVKEESGTLVNEQTFDNYYGAYTQASDGYYSVQTPNFTPTKVTFYDYEPKYYKVADGVDVIYLNNILANDSLDGIKAIASSGKKWNGGEFHGNFDGNGVTIRGMITQTGFVKKMDGTNCEIRNVHFDAAYAKNTQTTALVTTSTGGYQNSYFASAEDCRSAADKARKTTAVTHDSFVTIANVSVRHSYIAVDQKGYANSTGYESAAGIISFRDTPDRLTIAGCLFDGVTSELIDGNAPDGYSGNSQKAGLVSTHNDNNNITINDSVSIGEYFISMRADKTYNRYNSSKTGKLSFSNNYSPLGNTTSSNGVVYDRIINGTTDISTITSFEMADMPTLNWLNVWSLVNENGNNIPTITGTIGENSKKNFTTELMNQHSGAGMNWKSASAMKGRYGWEHLLQGSGTASDPYIITNALELANAIASGGANIDRELCYKLATDIDLEGIAWLTQNDSDNFRYTPFRGTLDGDGHIISGLYAMDIKAAAALIPVLDGGTVKNLHIRDSYAGSKKTAGIIAGGTTEKGGTITGCSVEDSLALAVVEDDVFAVGYATIEGSYYTTTDAEGKKTATYTDGEPTADDYYSAENPDGKWYKVAGGLPHLVNMAKAHSITDIDGDGEFGAEAYSATDLAALRRRLLDHADYSNIYGDVNGDGKISITDLALIHRQMTGTYNSINDGFWRNVELGKVAIYFAENDTVDMARKLELNLESVYPNVNILKYASKNDVYEGLTVDGRYEEIPKQHAIVIEQFDGTVEQKTKTVNGIEVVSVEGTYGDYSVNYDAKNNVLTISGGSFTAVEQAVLDFIADYAKTQTKVPNGKFIEDSILSQTRTESVGYTDMSKITDKNAQLVSDNNSAYKQAVVVDGKTYYYAWGDEFQGDGSFDNNKWSIGAYKGEVDDKGEGSSNYMNQENGQIDELYKMWVVKDGKLTVRRGVNVQATDISLLSDADKIEFNNIVNGNESVLGYAAIHNGNSDSINDFGDKVNNNDVFVDPGLIKTNATMLYKQGYAEARIALPSDGFAFPAWWTYGGIGDRNLSDIEQTLYGKVYALNKGDADGNYAWDGVSTQAYPDGTRESLSTYKYKLPRAYLEFDIVEFMQGSNSGGKADYRNFFQLTVHRTYSQNGYDKDGSKYLYIPDWNDYEFPKQNQYTSTTDFGTTSTGQYIHRYKNTESNIAMYPYLQINQKGGVSNRRWETTVFNSGTYLASFSLINAVNGISPNAASNYLKDYYGKDAGKIAQGQYTNNIVDTNDSHMALQKYFTYGFSWFVDEEAKTYSLTIYCDLNQNGIMETEERIFNMDQANCKDESSFTDPTRDPDNDGVNDDADIWNQYNYIMLDNAFYSSSGSTQNKDLLVDEDGYGSDKTTLDVEYVRVYQADGMRDIVTPETEAFNNGDRFNYGKGAN